jgi:uncharacterized SAM-dependent methyltransferase
MRALIAALRPTPAATCVVGDYPAGGADLPCPQQPQHLLIATCPACGQRAEKVCSHHLQLLRESMHAGEAFCAGLCAAVEDVTALRYLATYTI